VDLSQYSEEEESDIIHAEQLMDLRQFGVEVVRIYSKAKDRQTADALVDKLKSLFFLDYTEKKKRDIAKEAEELVEMTRKAYKVRWGPRGLEMEIGK
jgi:hypothetical protein